VAWVVGGVGGVAAWRRGGVAAGGVVISRLQRRLSLKRRRSVDFDFAETAGGFEFCGLTAGLRLLCRGLGVVGRCQQG